MPQKRDITLKLDADIVREARILAAQRGSSISRLLAEKLEELLTEDRGYERARKRDYARVPTSGRSAQLLAANYMSDKYFVDTNVLVCAHDISQGVKHQRARAVVDKLCDSDEPS